jgi:hypothetical protein
LEIKLHSVIIYHFGFIANETDNEKMIKGSERIYCRNLNIFILI